MATSTPSGQADSVKSSRPKALRGLWPFLRPYRGQLILAAVFMVLAAAATLAFPAVLRQLIDQGLVPNDRGSQTLMLRDHFALLFAVAVALGVFSAARFYVVSWLGERVTADLRQAVYDHVLHMSPEFFETTQTGEVVSRLTTDTTLVQTVVGSSLSMGLRNAVMGLGALVVLVWSHPVVMLQVLAMVVGVVLPAMAFGRRVRRLSRASQDGVAQVGAVAVEVLNAIPTVQSYTAESRESARFRQATQVAFDTATRRSRARAVLVAFIIIANAALVLWGLFQGTQAVLAGRMTAGELGQASLYVIIFAGAVAVLGEVYGDLLRAAGATERLMELLSTPSKVAEPISPVPLPAQPGGVSLSLNGLSFHYPSRPQAAALDRVSLEVAPGRTVALVGPSGAGKSTLFGLLLRFHDPSAGDIRLNGVPIAQLSLHALRSHIGLVSQDPVIFSTSALENIRYGRPDASDEEVKAAARSAFADGFLNALPDGYNTFLGERGVRLSGGQRQRIAIARALLKNPPLLLLDEATSALDAESERAVQQALEVAMAGRTTLVIAHRLATVQQAHDILVLDHGQLVERGTHAQLIHQGGLYARLAALQFQS